MKPQFLHPITPHVLNQRWGTWNPEIYAQFGFNRHNGLDLALSLDKHIVSPCNGTVVRVATKENGLWQPNGGGVFLGIMSEEMDFPIFVNVAPDGTAVHFPRGTCRTLVDLLHLDHILVKEGDTVTAGQLVAIGDNTGFSTGPHCHTQWRRVTWTTGTSYTTVDTNDANNSFDPTQFFTTTVFKFITNMEYKQTNDDVKNLQERLKKEGFFPQTQTATGFYGDITANALLSYQLMNKIDTVANLIKLKGHYCGPLTRAALNK